MTAPAGDGEPALRIAMLAPISWRTPPSGYGPWEAVASTLSEALVASGHHVTLFAAKGSATAGRLVETVPGALSEDPSLDAKVHEAMHVATAFEAVSAGGFDVLHSHADLLPLAFSRLVDVPFVTTIHGLGSPETQKRVLPIWQRYADRVAYVAISDADRHPALRYAATIHHGLDARRWPAGRPGPDAPLVFFGRMHPDKAPDAAIRIARRAGVPLELAGIVHDRSYFEREVEPRIDGQAVRWLGNVEGADRARVLGRARGLLHPVAFAEPFGLSVAEAMMCGTPVVAMRRGAMPELIEHGRTGFLVDSEDAAVEAVARLGSIDRRLCRARARERFGAARMAQDHVDLYRRLIGARLR